MKALGTKPLFVNTEKGSSNGSVIVTLDKEYYCIYVFLSGWELALTLLGDHRSCSHQIIARGIRDDT